VLGQNQPLEPFAVPKKVEVIRVNVGSKLAAAFSFFIIIGNERKKLKAQGECGYIPMGEILANVY
jgi:hypothetical protein